MDRPRRGRRSVIGLAAALASTVTLATLSTQITNAQPPVRLIGPRRTLRLETYKPSIMDPVHIRDAASASLATEIFGGLTRIGVDLAVEPDVASGWDVSENGLYYSFHIRPDAIFHNQRSITAYDVKASWERALAPSTRSLSAPTYLGNILGARDVIAGRTKTVPGLQVEDRLTLNVTLTEPSKIFPAQLTNGPSLIIDHRDLVHGHAWWQEPNGSGPYKLNSWSEQAVLLERAVTSQWLGAGPQQVRLQQLDLGESLLRYEQGDLDIAQIGGATVARFRDEREPRHADLLSTPKLCRVYLGFNVAVAPFEDVHVRRALAMTIDRHRINQVTLNDTALEAYGMLPPGIAGYRPEFRGLSFDISAARAELARSSYRKANALPAITLITPGTGVLADSLTQAIVEPFNDHLGIEINIELWDFEDYIKTMENPRHTHQMFSSGWVADFPDPFNFLDVLFYSERPDNSFRLLDTTVDELLARARAAPSEQER